MTPEQAKKYVEERLAQSGLKNANVEVEELNKSLTFIIRFPASLHVPQMLDIVNFPKEDGFRSPSVEGNIGYVHFPIRN